MAKRRLAFVLSGGGARGALQVGALRALVEAGRQPDLLVGTSIGACNAAYLALHGVSLATIDSLEGLWRQAATADLLPPRYLWLTVRNLISREDTTRSERRIRDFFVRHGLAPEVRFGDVRDVRLIVVAADLNHGQPVLYGTSPEDSILEGVLASSALPPWVRPRRRGEQLLVDGGFISNLPIEAAVSQGAADIVALDLSDPFGMFGTSVRFRPGWLKYYAAMQQRQIDMELQLAAAYDVPVNRIALRTSAALPAGWDFSRTEELMALGYGIARAALSERQPVARTRWWTARDWLARPAGRLSRRWAASA